MKELLLKAAKIALPSDPDDLRTFWLGAVGIRKDGKHVYAKNGAARFHDFLGNYETLPASHAEGRLVRKLGKGGIIFVARVARKDGSLKIARPCGMCRTLLHSARVHKAYYTINSFQYGIWDVAKDYDEVFYF